MVKGLVLLWVGFLMASAGAACMFYGTWPLHEGVGVAVAGAGYAVLAVGMVLYARWLWSPAREI